MLQPEILAWMKLSMAGLPYQTTNQLIRLVGSPLRLFELTDKEAARLSINAKQLDKLRRTQSPDPASIKYIEDGCAEVVPINSEAYPKNLKAYDDSPTVLYVRGTLCDDDQFGISIVGTRKASAYGMMASEKLAKDLASAGLTVITGGASGIDSAAIEGAIQANGRAIVVLGGGVDVVYPPANRLLFDKTIKTGALISEFPIGMKPNIYSFPIRNRTIAGLSMGVIVVEAPEKSGALITANRANEKNVPVFVVPASIDAGSFKGSHSLIRDGASLVTNADDVLQHLGIEKSNKTSGQKETKAKLTDRQRKILAVLTLEPTHVDWLVRHFDIDAPTLIAELTIMEMLGVIKRLPGGTYIRTL